MRANLKRLSALGLGLSALALVLAVPCRLRADDDEAKPQGDEAPSLSDDVGDALGKIRPLLDAKDWAGAVKLIDDILPSAKPDSYDLTILYGTKARILLQEGDYADSLEPLEQSLEISDRHHYNTLRQTMEDLYLLSQLYFQDAGNAKLPKDQQLGDYQKAIAYIERWFTLNTKPSEEMSLYYATLLYQEAVATNGEHPDPDLVQKTQDEVIKALHINPRPRENLYVLLLATLQQQGKIAEAADVTELLLQKHPTDKAYWPDLVGFYVNLAQASGKNDETFRKYYIRAINALERAQALGFMQTPRDNFLLFTFYYDTGQFGTAADLLYSGLMSGSIASEVANWQLLATSYQQINQDFKAIEVLKEAAKRYPENGQFDFQIAQIYTGMDKNEEAYDYETQAVNAGGLDKPWVVYNTLAYSAYELSKFDEAKVAIDKAIELKGGEPDHQATSLRNAIEEAIRERDDKNAKQAAQ